MLRSPPGARPRRTSARWSSLNSSDESLTRILSLGVQSGSSRLVARTQIRPAIKAWMATVRSTSATNRGGLLINPVMVQATANPTTKVTIKSRRSCRLKGDLILGLAGGGRRTRVDRVVLVDQVELV